MKRKYAPSKVIAVRYHLDELAVLDKARKKVNRSDFIRAKSLQFDKIK